MPARSVWGNMTTAPREARLPAGRRMTAAFTATLMALGLLLGIAPPAGATTVGTSSVASLAEYDPFLDFTLDDATYDSSYRTYPGRARITVYVTTDDGFIGTQNGVLTVRDRARQLWSKRVGYYQTPSTTLPTLAPGRHTITVSYSGDAFYRPAATSQTFDVRRGTTPVTVTAASNAPLSARLNVATRSPSGAVSAVYKGRTVARGNLSNGRVSLAIPRGLQAGRQTISVRFAGTANYAPASRNVTATVRSYTPTVKVAAASTRYPARAKVTVTVTGSHGRAIGTVAVSRIGGKFTLSAGKRTITLPQLKPGTYRITAKYNGGSIYGARTATASIKITGTVAKPKPPVVKPKPPVVKPNPPAATYYANCTDVWNRIGRSLYRGEPGYEAPRLDRDYDGVACENRP